MSSRLPFLANSIMIILGIMTILGGRPYFFADALTGLYGLDLAELDALSIALLQHRGMMVSLIGALLIPSVFSHDFGKIAIPIVIFSKASFVFRLYAFRADVGAVYFDIVAIVLLLIIYIWRYGPSQSRANT